MLTERLLVSGRHQALCAVDATRRVLEGGHRVETVAALLEKIIDEVADTMDRMADKIGTDIDDIEEQVLAGDIKPEMRGQLGRQRRTARGRPPTPEERRGRAGEGGSKGRGRWGGGGAPAVADTRGRAREG